jgi:hypothetical protein
VDSNQCSAGFRAISSNFSAVGVPVFGGPHLKNGMTNPVTFGVATAGLTTALFVPNPSTMIHGLHKALLLGLLTILLTSVFRSLTPSDGSNVSSQKLVHHG